MIRRIKRGRAADLSPHDCVYICTLGWCNVTTPPGSWISAAFLFILKIDGVEKQEAGGSN